MILPLYFKADGMPCLIVGGGRVAARKVELLLEAACTVTVVAPEVDESVRVAAARGILLWQARGYMSGDCKGFRLVVAATPLVEVNRAVSMEAQNLGIPVNVVDDPELCTVIFSAVWRDGPLTVAVSSGGAAPFMAVAVRNRIAKAAEGMGSWVVAAGKFRAAVRAEVTERTERDRLYRLFENRVERGLPPRWEEGWTLQEWIDRLELAEPMK